MTLIRPQIALMDTDCFEQRIKTDDTDCTNYSLEREFDVTREFDNSGLKKGRPQIARMGTDCFERRIKTLIRPQIAQMDTDYFEQRIKTDGHGLF